MPNSSSSIDTSMAEPAKNLPFAMKDNTLNVDSDNVRKMFGTSNEQFSEGLAGQLLNIVTQGQETNSKTLSAAGAMMAGIGPRDELEALLALQMLAIHNATMTFARKLAHVETITQQDSAERALNKLTRTFTMQMQALQKYRSGGKQKVTVKHVHVNEGGQAIVGNVETGGGMK
jgi:hypothetical protein